MHVALQDVGYVLDFLYFAGRAGAARVVRVTIREGVGMNGMFKGKVYGAVTVGERGQLVVPAELRRALHIESGDQLMVFAKLDKKVISLMPAKDFNKFLARASKLISKLESQVSNKD